MYFSSPLTALLGLVSLAAALPTDPSSSLYERLNSSNSTPLRTMVYVQTFSYPNGTNVTLLPLVNEKTGITHIELAALHINPEPGDIHLNDVNPNASMWNKVWSEVKTIQNDGVKVLFMLGGAGGNSYEYLCSGSGSNPLNMSYYTPLKETIAFHNIDGIDLDIEAPTSLACALSLLNQLNTDFGADFILTMAPVASALMPDGSNLSGFSYSTLDKKATSSTRPNGKLVNWYNCQFYNGFGDASSDSDYDSIVASGFAADRVVLGVLDNPNDGGSGWYPLSTYKSTIASIKSKNSNFGGVIGWEYFDAGVGDSDNLSAPWMWVKDIAQVVSDSPSTAAVEARTLPAKHTRNTPYQESTQKLVDVHGASWFEAVRALNRTHGDFDRAVLYLESN